MPTYTMQLGDGRKVKVKANTEREAWDFAKGWEAKNPKREPYHPVTSGAMGFGDTFLAGGMDEIGGALGYIAGRGYEPTRNAIREQQKLAQEDNPGSYMAGQIGGGVAQFAVPGTALIKGGSMAANAVRGAAGGAAAGGLYGVGSGTDAESRLEGGIQGAALGAATGAAAPVVGRAVGKAVEKLRRVPQKGIPTEDELLRAGGKNIEAAGPVQVPDKVVSKLALDASKYFRSSYVNAKNHPETFEAQKMIMTALQRARQSGGSIDLGDVHNIRQFMTTAAERASPQDAFHLRELKKLYDAQITSKVPGYEKGIADYAVAKRSERIGNLILGAPDKNSGARVPLSFEQVQRKFKAIVDDPDALSEFSPDEQALVKKIASGGRIGEKALGAFIRVTGLAGQSAAAIATFGATGGTPAGALMAAGSAAGVKSVNEMLKALRTNKASKTVEELRAIARNRGKRPNPRAYPTLERAATIGTVGTVPSQVSDLPEITVRPKRPMP